MHYKLKLFFTSIFIICMTCNVSAEKTDKTIKKYVITGGYEHLLETTWDIGFNIKLLKENKLLSYFNNYQLFINDNTTLQFKSIPSFIDYVYMYGSTLINQGHINVQLFGDFKEVSVENLVFNQLLKNSDNIQLKKLETYENNKEPVFVYKKIGDQSDEKLYATKVNDEFIIVSNRRITLKYKERKRYQSGNINSWEHNLNLRRLNRNNEKERLKNKNVLVSSRTNTEAVRKKLLEDSYLLQSKVFNNTNTIVFKVVKGESNIFIASALDTKNKETAEQINKVINSIIEKNINTNQKLDNINSSLINNLKTSIDDSRVILNTNIPLIHKNK